MNKIIESLIFEELDSLLEDNSPKSGYYITTGRGIKRYTLRHWFHEYDSYGNEVLKDRHVETYGQDIEVAKQKAKEKLGYVPEVRAGEVGKITQELTYQHMPNGQYQGMHFTEVPINYLAWWAEQYGNTPSYKKIVADIRNFLQEKKKEAIANYDKITFGKHAGTPIKDLPSNYLSWLMKESNNEIIRGAAELELQRRGEIVDGKTKTDIDKEEQRNKEEQRKAGSQWVGNVGDKVTLEVQYINEISFDSQWGTTYITRFVDRNGNTILYKGKSFYEPPREQSQVHNTYQIKNGEVVEIPNQYEGLFGDALWRKLPKKLYQVGGEYNPDGTMRFHTWYGGYDDPAKQVHDIVKNLSDSGKLPHINYIDDKGNLYLIEYSEEKISNFEKGDWILISGTISQQSEYKGEKQTAIQRPKFLKKL